MRWWGSPFRKNGGAGDCAYNTIYSNHFYTRWIPRYRAVSARDMTRREIHRRISKTTKKSKIAVISIAKNMRQN